MPDELEKLLERTKAQVAQERGLLASLRALSTPLRLIISGVCVLLVVGLPAWWVGHGLVPALGPVRVTALGGLLVLLAVSLEGVLRPAHRPPLSAGLLGTALALGVAVPGWTWASMAKAWPEPPPLETVACLVEGLTLGGVVWLVSWALEREGQQDLRRRALGGMAAVLTASAFLVLHCPQVALWHLALGHGGVLIGFGAAFAALARREGFRYPDSRS